jgi:hypothetical protein
VSKSEKESDKNKTTLSVGRNILKGHGDIYPRWTRASPSAQQVHRQEAEICDEGHTPWGEQIHIRAERQTNCNSKFLLWRQPWVVESRQGVSHRRACACSG